MSLKFIPNKGRPMYTVRTMYPELDAKQKKAMQSDFMSVPLAAETVRLSQQVNENANQIMYSKSYEVLKNILRMKGLVSDQKAESITKEFLMKFQDRMLPVGEIIDKLRSEGANITDALDTYQKETLYHGITGERINTATDSLYKPLAEITRNIDVENRFNELEASSDFVKQSLDVTGSKKVAAVEAYLYALHAKERNEYIRSIDPSNDSGSGMTDSEADRIIAWEGSLAPEQRAVFAEVRSKVRDIISDTNKIRRDSGLIPVNFETDKAAIDEEGTEFRLPPVYSDYIPLRGI